MYELERERERVEEEGSEVLVLLFDLFCVND